MGGEPGAATPVPALCLLPGVARGRMREGAEEPAARPAGWPLSPVTSASAPSRPLPPEAQSPPPLSCLFSSSVTVRDARVRLPRLSSVRVTGHGWST